MTPEQINDFRKKGFLHGDGMQCGHCKKLMAAIDELIAQADQM